MVIAVIIIVIYRSWYRLGGDSHYHPPAPWNENNIEEMPIVPTAGPQSKWLNISLRLFQLDYGDFDIRYRAAIGVDVQ